MREPLFTETLQIAIVVRDLEATMRTYVEEYGIGPWELYEFEPHKVAPLGEGEPPTDAAWRLAVTMVGSVQWELVQPLDYRDAIDGMRANGRRVLLGGVYEGATFAYLSTDEDLKVLTEIFDWPEGLVQEPDAVYPS
jgi:hypothetical protein